MSELLEDAAQDWIAERRAVGRTISTETAKAYRADLASWQRYLEAQTGAPARVQDLTGPVIKAALAEMNNAGLAPASRRRLVTTLRGLCRYLVLESRLPADPTAAIQAPRAPSRLPVDAEPSRQAMILAGPPGAGKSTLRRGPLREETAEHVLRI